MSDVYKQHNSSHISTFQNEFMLDVRACYCITYIFDGRDGQAYGSCDLNFARFLEKMLIKQHITAQLVLVIYWLLCDRHCYYFQPRHRFMLSTIFVEQTLSRNSTQYCFRIRVIYHLEVCPLTLEKNYKNRKQGINILLNEN